MRGKGRCLVSIAIGVLFSVCIPALASAEYYDYYSKLSKLDTYNFLYKKYLPSKIKKEIHKNGKTLPDGDYHVVPVGPLKIWVAALPDIKFLVVTHVDENGLGAKYKLRQWDEIHGVNGHMFAVAHTREAETGVAGPIFDLAMAIEASQLRGKLALLVKRNGRTRRLVVSIEELGRFAESYPYKCKKSRKLFTEVADRLSKRDGRSPVGKCFAGVSLLATGESKYLPAIEEIVDKVILAGDRMNWNKPFRVSDYSIGNSWCSGATMIFLAEYFWATGDLNGTAKATDFCQDATYGGLGEGWLEGEL